MHTNKSATLHFLSGGGEMGKCIRNFDWNNTPLGDPEQWSESFKNVVSLLLVNRFPMILWWGSEYIQLYNDPYIPIPGLKHPKQSLGQRASECWNEIWHIIGPLIDTPFNGGPATWMDDIQLVINRNNFVEETHFTIAYSPVPDCTAPNNIGGVLATVNEITAQVINERSLDTLNRLSVGTSQCKTESEVFEKAAEALKSNGYDFPFALFYKINAQATEATRCALVNIDENDPFAPASIDLTVKPGNGWDISETISSGQPLTITDLQQQIGDMPMGNWEVHPSHALIIPILQKGKENPVAAFITGINPYRKLDDKYITFLRLLSEQIEQALHNVNVIEDERRRAETLEELDKAKTIFFSNISHEFRTPITLILGPLEEMLNRSRTNLSKDDLKQIETTHRNALRLLKLVNTLLDFSRIESGRQQALYVLTDISTFTRALVANFHTLMERAGLKLIINADSIIQPVYVDRQMWEKIVFNLLNNAFKFTLHGKITVTLDSGIVPLANGEESQGIRFTVNDTGVGIPEEELPNMFDRFHRVKSTAGRSFEGTGIGLSLVKELVNLHGGTIIVTSTQGEGSEFTVTIPFGKTHLPSSKVMDDPLPYERVISDVYIEEAASMLAPESGSDEFESKGVFSAEHTIETVLIVDDNADMREYIQSILNKRYITITAANGMDALHKVMKLKPSLILSDVMMPVMDGHQLLKQLKSYPITQNIPVILLTARAGEESKLEGFEIGADDYLVKPFSAKELVSRIDLQLRIKQRQDRAMRSICQLFDAVPFGVVALKGRDLVVDYINQFNLGVWQMKKDDVIGHPLFEAKPELLSTGQMHREVYRTGKRFEAKNVPVSQLVKGKNKTRYFDTIIDPIVDEMGRITGQLATSFEVKEKKLTRRKAEVLHSGTKIKP